MSAAARKRISAAMKTALGKVEGKDCSKEVQKPYSNECSCQEEVVGVDEGALGCAEKGGGVVQGLTALSGGAYYSSIPSVTMTI